MKRRTIVLTAAVLLAPVTAFAQGELPSCSRGTAGSIAPYAWAFVNGACTDFSEWIFPDTGHMVWNVNSPTLDLGAASVQLRGRMDGDPFITFGATTTIFSPGPVTFAFLFGTPIVPGSYNTATSTGGVSVTNGARGNTTVTTSGVYPTYISGYGTVGFTPTNLGVDLGTAACNSTGTPFTVTTVCGQGSLGNSFPLTFYDGLQALLTYTQDDAFSVASWSGAVTLSVVATPEPATIALVGLGLVFVGGVARRRRT